MDELKPCPFCREKARIASCTRGELDIYIPLCSKCSCMLKPWPSYFATIEEATDAWNKRV
jgi:hypothetical protein